MRLDRYLCLNGFVSSRERAKRLIENSFVTVDGKIVTKASFEIDSQSVEVTSKGFKYVSRGGLKLEKALDEFKVDPSGLVCADLGASSGGFTDCLLQRGAEKVYSIDVGKDQLDDEIRKNEKVVVMEGFNVRNLTVDTLPDMVSLAVCDLSFISQTLIHKNVYSILVPGGIFISLIKPQFEAGRGNVGKIGIVKDEKIRKKAIDDVLKSAKSAGFEFLSHTRSPIEGGDGNIEYLAAFRKTEIEGK